MRAAIQRRASLRSSGAAQAQRGPNTPAASVMVPQR